MNINDQKYSEVIINHHKNLKEINYFFLKIINYFN